jgi:hypothetical protein
VGGLPIPISLLSLLCTFRGCDVSDPRGKVFAFLDMASRANPQSVTEADIMKPDYRHSVLKVYIAASEFILRSTEKLTILSHVQDLSLTRVKGLPSWVPDLSVDLGRSAFEVEEPSHWSASGNLSVPWFKSTRQMNLALDGLMVDTALDVAALKRCYFVQTAKVVLGTPAWYLDHRPKLIGYRPYFVDKDHESVSFPIPGQFSCPPKSRVEAFWRTLTADCFEEHHPAPIRCGFGFSDWIRIQLIVRWTSSR